MTRHITIGDLSLRLSLVADALGIPAATLERLASGEWVAVPKEPTDLMTHVGQRLRYVSAWSIGAIYREMLAAATEAGSHDD